ncbi:MAG: discoidin domain-containing protein, partial [Clostridia bacterium]|nr:discoidin domain-containing protein [Clostridia bacterium]
MKTHSRRLSMALAIVMVLSLLVAFPAVVSAADTNLANGLTPAVVGADGTTVVFGSAEGYTAHPSGAQALTAVTDGDYGTAQSTTLELLGSNRVWEFTFTLAETSTLSSVAVYFFDGLTSGADDTRAWNADTFAVTVDGVTVAGTGVSTSGLTYGYADTKYAYTFNAPVTGKTVKISASSPKYVLAIGEIEIMGSVGTSGEGGGSTDTPVVTPGVATNYVSGLTATSVFDNINHGAEATGGYLSSGGAQTYAVLTDGVNASAQAEALELCGTASVWDVTFDLGATKTDISSVVIYSRNSYAADASADARAFDSSKIAVLVSTDNATWTTATGSYVEEAVDGYTNLKVTYTLNAPATARYMKITVAPTFEYVLALGEIEVWGGASSSDTPSTDSFALAMTASDAQYNGADCVAVDIV